MTSLALQSGSSLAELEALHELATVAMLAHGDDGPLLAADRGPEPLATGRSLGRPVGQHVTYVVPPP